MLDRIWPQVRRWCYGSVRMRTGARRNGTRHLRGIESLEQRQLLHGGLLNLETAFAEGEGEVMPDFALVDVNSTSSTHEQSVSPREYLQQVSAWYFGHAT